MPDPRLIYNRHHPCFAWRKGCTKLAEVQMETSTLCLAMCKEHAQDFSTAEGFKVYELPESGHA